MDFSDEELDELINLVEKRIREWESYKIPFLRVAIVNNEHEMKPMLIRINNIIKELDIIRAKLRTMKEEKYA